jgi:hypothetical protein
MLNNKTIKRATETAESRQTLPSLATVVALSASASGLIADSKNWFD